MKTQRTNRNPQGATLSRRGFLKAGVAAGGGLLLSVSLPDLAVSRQGGAELGVWLRIGADNSVTVLIPSAEMGQGITTALAMIVAEELEIGWQDVRAELAPVDPAYANPKIGMQATFGSHSVRGFFDPLREAGAVAREMLREAAADSWDVPVTECDIRDGVVTHPSGRSATYGELAARAAERPVPASPKLKPPAAWTKIGKPLARLDTPSKVDGSAVYGIDVDIEGMKIATVAACPTFGGKLARVDHGPALAVTGVEAVIELEDAVAVVATNYWQARKGIEALSPEWDLSAAHQASNARIESALLDALEGEAAVAEQVGAPDKAFQSAAKTIEATYELPFLAHMAMEPLCATAHVTDTHCRVWAPTQGPAVQKMVLAQVLGLDDTQVEVIPTLLGGAFGRKSGLDNILQAAFISKFSGHPIKLIWSREEDVQHDFYRPAAAAKLRAGFDAGENLSGWAATIASPSIMSRVYPAAVHNGVDPTAVEGLVDAPYAFPTREVRYALTDVGVPVGFWRSVGHSITGFLAEAFMDEMAEASGADPVAFRLSLLGDHPRHAHVLREVARMSDWDNPAPEGRFRGVALHACMGSIVAEVAEISLEQQRIRVHRVDCVIDCGIAVNPDTIVAQMESGIVYGLSAALNGTVQIDKGRVLDSNFNTNTPITMAQMPKINVKIVQSDEAPGGAGEPSTPPIAPALVNALYQATGRRFRSLPLSAHGFDS